MTYKFRSLTEHDLILNILDLDGDEVTIQFHRWEFETDDDNIGQAAIADSRNGIVFMDSDYVERKKAQDEGKKKVAAAKKKVAAQPKPQPKPKSKSKKK